MPKRDYEDQNARWRIASWGADGERENRARAHCSVLRRHRPTANGPLRAIYIICTATCWLLARPVAPRRLTGAPLLFLIVFGSGLSSASVEDRSRTSGGISYIQSCTPHHRRPSCSQRSRRDVDRVGSRVWILKRSRRADRSLSGAIGKALGARPSDDPGPHPARPRSFVGVRLSVLTVLTMTPSPPAGVGLSSFGGALASSMSRFRASRS